MKKSNLLHDDIYELMKKLSIPSMMSMFMTTALNVTDTYFAGNYADAALSALGASDRLFFLIIGTLFGFSSATTALVGNSLGRSKVWLAKKYIYNSIFSITVLSLLLGSFGLLSSNFFLSLFSQDLEFLNFGVGYINVIFMGTIFIALQTIFNSILVAEGDTKSGRNAMFISFLANIVFDYLLVPRYGTVGLAFATIFVQLISSVYLGYKVQQSNIVNLFSFREFAPSFRLIKQIFEQAIYSSLNMILMATGGLLQIYYASSYGENAIASYGAGMRVEQLCLTPVLSINAAVLTIVARNYGARKYDRVREAVNAGLKIALFLSIIGFVILTVFGKTILEQFNGNTEIIEMSYKYVFVASFSIFAYGSLFIGVATLQGLKQPKFIFPISFYRQILAPITIFTLVVFYFKMEMEYMFYSLGFIVWSSAIIMYLYVKNTMNKVLVKKVVR